MAIYFVSVKRRMLVFLQRDKLNNCFSFWWCKGKNYLSIAKYFFKNIIIIQMYDKSDEVKVSAFLTNLLKISYLNLFFAKIVFLNLVRTNYS